MKRVSFGFVFVVALTFASPTQAALLDCVNDAVTLADLLDDGSCQVGDKLFSEFDFRPTPLDATPTADNIRVLGIEEGGLFGIQFEGAFVATSGQLIDFVIEYMVTVLDPSRLLSDIHLEFNGDAGGTGLANIVETVENLGGTIIGSASVNTFDPKLSDVALLDEQVSQAIVTKDILLTGGSNGFATISVIEQLTSQTPIPEPATMTLLGTGLLGVARYARRRKKAQA